MSNTPTNPESPNILMIMVDQLRYPRFSYKDKGLDTSIKDILSFVNTLDKDDEYLKNFPGFVKLREYSTVLTNHSIAESACIPSRGSIMTGQYGPRTGVTQTDGLFKSGDAQNFPWLKADGFATIGDWFRAAGYSTHYFGKWHTSNPPEHTLQAFGFDDWELSWPEPHGSLINNLGTYRDYQFADLACSFLRNRGLSIPYNRAVSEQSEHAPNSSETPVIKPFFAVCSFTNPHDIAAYPTLPRSLDGSVNNTGPGGSVPVPEKGTLSTVPVNGYLQVPLNPTGLPQDNATASPTQDEDLLNNNKPSCQYDYSIKCGLGLAAKLGLSVAQKLADGASDKELSKESLLKAAVAATMKVAIPFQTQDDAEGAATGFLQYYTYMISMVDRHILRVIESLEESGLRENTILVFVSDHGEYGAAHSMMMEKWHTAYQEVLHVPVLVSSPNINPDASQAKSVDGITSHIDLLPTLMGLANINEQQQKSIRKQLSKTHYVDKLPGIDLSEVIKTAGNKDYTSSNPVPDLTDRSVLFVTDDMITEPLPMDSDPHNKNSWEQYAVYSAAVAELKQQNEFSALELGSVIQPAHVRAVRQGDWKLVRYCDPWSKKPVADQWELYNLAADGNEAINLVIYNASQFPTVIDESKFPPELQMNTTAVEKVALKLRAELIKLEQQNLTPYPSEYPTAGAD